MDIKKVAIWGAVAVGGYLLYTKVLFPKTDETKTGTSNASGKTNCTCWNGFRDVPTACGTPCSSVAVSK